MKNHSKGQKFLGILLSLMLVLSCSAFATGDSTNQAPSTTSTTTYITDREALNQYIIDHNVVIPEGKSLESVKVTVTNDPDLINQANTSYQSNMSARQGLLAKGVITLDNRVYKGTRYYSDQPYLSDTIQGPMSTGPKIQFDTSTTAGFNGSCGVTSSMITASFGVNFSKTITVTRTYQFNPIPVGKYLRYSAFVNYAVYDFTVYSDQIKQGTSTYWTPVGIVVTQELIG